MAVGNTFFIASYGPLQSSHQGDHQEIAGYGAGYGPLQETIMRLQVMDLFRVFIKNTDGYW